VVVTESIRDKEPSGGGLILMSPTYQTTHPSDVVYFFWFQVGDNASEVRIARRTAQLFVPAQIENPKKPSVAVDDPGMCSTVGAHDENCQR
jgi:hypothetical protein